MRGGSKTRTTGWGVEMPVQFRMHENGHVAYLSVMRKYLCYITCCWFKMLKMNLYITNSLPFVRLRKTRREAYIWRGERATLFIKYIWKKTMLKFNQLMLKMLLCGVSAGNIVHIRMDSSQADCKDQPVQRSKIKSFQSTFQLTWWVLGTQTTRFPSDEITTWHMIERVFFLMENTASAFSLWCHLQLSLLSFCSENSQKYTFQFFILHFFLA